MDELAKNTQRFVDSVTEYADNVLKCCRDKYGDKETPLLTDGIYPETGEPMKWEEYVLSNLACQQNFLRTLDGLSVLTGEAKYQKHAQEWISYALSVLQDSESGMLYWGGHTSYDLLENKFGKKRDVYLNLKRNHDHIDAVLQQGAERARALAIPMMEKVRRKIGMRR